MTNRWTILAGLAVLFMAATYATVWSQSGDEAPAGQEALENAPAEKGDESAGNAPSTQKKETDIVQPLIILAVGVATVLGLIIALKVNAFIALITAAIVVSLMSVGMLGQGSWAGSIGRVASAFGGSAADIGIVIALAAVIGKCMLDSGAADRIVRAFLRVLGEKGSPVALMGSGFVLAVPVFFDTVFYLLVPLARSLHRRTKRNYLMYIMAIGAGGAITHTLVPPTPGPLMMASNLGFDIGWMIIIGSIVAIPPAVVGVILAGIVDRLMNVPMRPIGSEPEPDPLKDEELPSLFMSLMPVVLPVVLIATNTVLTTIADGQQAALLKPADADDWSKLTAEMRDQAAANRESPGGRILAVIENGKTDRSRRTRTSELIRRESALTDAERDELIAGLNKFVLQNKGFHGGDDERAFVGVFVNTVARGLLGEDRQRMKQANVERMNRSLLESAYGDLIQPHHWNTQARQAADISSLFGNANLALLISAVIALLMVVRQRQMSRSELAQLVETSLMSGGVIILITAAGGAFGAMLKVAQIGDAIQALFEGSQGGGGSGGVAMLILAFMIGSMLKIAQGSGTVSMIVGTSMMAAILGDTQLSYHVVYIACAVGSGSLVCSWMNDSGFWIFAKMGGLTEGEALKSWTVMLVVLGFVSLGMTILMSQVLPLAG